MRCGVLKSPLSIEAEPCRVALLGRRQNGCAVCGPRAMCLGSSSPPPPTPARTLRFQPAPVISGPVNDALLPIPSAMGGSWLTARLFFRDRPHRPIRAIFVGAPVAPERKPAERKSSAQPRCTIQSRGGVAGAPEPNQDQPGPPKAPLLSASGRTPAPPGLRNLPAKGFLAPHCRRRAVFERDLRPRPKSPLDHLFGRFGAPVSGLGVPVRVRWSRSGRLNPPPANHGCSEAAACRLDRGLPCRQPVRGPCRQSPKRRGDAPVFCILIPEQIVPQDEARRALAWAPRKVEGNRPRFLIASSRRRTRPVRSASGTSTAAIHSVHLH